MTNSPHLPLHRAPLLPLRLGIAAALLLASGASADPAGPGFSGVWRHVGGKAEKREVRAAIDTSLEGMTRVLRGLARDRLRRGSRVPHIVTIRAAPDLIAIRDGDRDVLASPPDQVVRRTVASTGDAIELLHALEPGALVQYRTTPDGGRRTTYRLAADGQRLIVSVLTSSHYLPAPIRYELTYERVAVASSARSD